MKISAALELPIGQQEEFTISCSGLCLQDAAVAVVKNEQVDGGRVCVTGGSHGGFLSAHLIGQFPVSIVINFHTNMHDVL